MKRSRLTGAFIGFCVGALVAVFILTIMWTVETFRWISATYGATGVIVATLALLVCIATAFGAALLD